MNTIEHNAMTLSSFGLTVKQAKVYLALVSLGTAPVGEISQLSKVRREEVYRILPKLEKMGLIEKTLTVPVKLKATSVDNALSILIREEEEKAKSKIIELKAKKEEFIQGYRKGSKDGRFGSGEQFSVISEKAVSLGKAESLIENAKAEIDYCVSREKLHQFLRFFSETLAEAVARNVRIRVITTTPHGDDDLPRAVNKVSLTGKRVAVRYLENLPNHFLVIDQSEVLIATEKAGYLADNPLLWSNNASHVEGYKRLFEELWNSSVEIAPVGSTHDEERLVAYLKGMRPKSHSLLMYETKAGKLKVILNYVKVALDNNQAVVYVCSEESVEEVKMALQQFGVDVKAAENLGALKVLDYTQHYIIDGVFDREKIGQLWKRYYSEAVSKGFKELRAVGETQCFYKHNLLRELLEYEKYLDNTLDIPMVTLCAYNAQQLMNEKAVKIYPELARIHGEVTFTWADKTLGRIAIS